MYNYDYHNTLENEMQLYRNEALKKLATVVKPDFMEEFAKILHYSWLENLETAEILAEKLDLYPIHFVALAQNISEFEDLLLKDKELQMEDYA